MKFDILVQQDIKSWFDGSIKIEAETYEQALEIANSYSQEELNNIVEWYEMGDIEDNGDITIIKETENKI